MLKIKDNAPLNPEIDVELENGVFLFLMDWNGEKYTEGATYNETTGTYENTGRSYKPVYDENNEFSIIGYEEDYH